MVKMTNESKSFLRKNMPEVVESEEPNAILEQLYDLIIKKGFTTSREYNDFGKKAQEVYDDFFYSNFE